MKIAPFDRPYATFYWSAIVNIALSCTIFELFDVELYRDLEIGVIGHSRSLKLVPFESSGAVSYSPSIVTMVVSVAVCEIFTVKEWCDLENGVIGFVQGHWKWHHLIFAYEFLLTFHSNYGDILYRLRVIATYW